MKPTEGRSTGRGVQSIEVGARVLKALMDSGSPMMLRDVAEAADLIPAQAHAYLVSFRRVELVEQEAGTGKYLLGPAAARMAVARIRSSDVLAAASREVVALSEETGLMSGIVVWGPYGPTAVQVREGAQSLNLNLRAGSTFGVTTSASGRIFATFGADDAILTRMKGELAAAPKEIGKKAATARFEAQRAEIRAAGYSWAINSPVPGLCSIAAPVRSAEGELLLAIAIIAKAEGLDVSSQGPAVRRLVATAQRVSAVMAEEHGR